MRGDTNVTLDLRLFIAWVLAAIVMVLVVAAVLTTALLNLSNSLTQGEEADYRICERASQSRAEQYVEAARDPPPDVNMLRRRLVLFDCRPNLEGRPARALSREEAATYLRSYQRGELDPTP